MARLFADHGPAVMSLLNPGEPPRHKSNRLGYFPLLLIERRSIFRGELQCHSDSISLAR